MFALAPSAPKAETERCALGAPKGIVHPTRKNATYFAPITRDAEGCGHARKGLVGKLPPRTEKLPEHNKPPPLIKSFAELSYRKATVSPKQTTTNHKIQEYNQ